MFGKGGSVLTDISIPGYDYFFPTPEIVRVQPDGKILVCGRFWEDGISSAYGTIMVRYMPDGSLDPSFGINGKVAVIGDGYPYGNRAVGKDMLLQPDGKIVLIGDYSIAAGIIFYRYTPSGVLDVSFGNNGMATVSVGTAFTEGTSISLQADGKIVGAGWEYDNYWDLSNYYDAIVVFRLNPNGSLDTSFGPTGTGVFKIVNGNSSVKVLVQLDGKVVIAGTLHNFRDVAPTMLLARYHPDGTPDLSFGSGGKITLRINGRNSQVSNVALQPDGKLLVTGNYHKDEASQPVLIRFNTNGSFDNGFGTNGILELDSLIPSTVLVQTDGKIVAIGNNAPAAQGVVGFAIRRLLSDGSTDVQFGINGQSVFPIQIGGTGYGYASAGTIQANGKILAVGFAGIYPPDHKTIALIRVNGGRDSTPFDFDGDGKADQGVFRPAAGAWYLLRSRDGVDAYGFGLAGDRLVAADYDGDGKTDAAIYRDGVWWILNSSGTGYQAIQWGIASDTPVPADYDGDGKADLAVYRDGTWWILYGNGAGYSTINWGLATDKPVPADYDGDGKADFAIYRGGEWWILFADGSGYTTAQWGISTDKPIPSDFDGDGKADFALYRDGEWWILNTLGQPSMIQWGIPGDVPVPADYDGDGRTDISIYRTGEWWTLLPTGYTQNNWGIANDIPVSGR